MAVYTVTTGDVDGAGLTFSEALALADANAGKDTIKFATDVQFVMKDGSFGIGAAGGSLVIDGDHDGDGITDVVFLGGSGTHLVIAAGADVEIRNVDFIGAGERKHYESAEAGESGVGGEHATVAGLSGYDGSDGHNDATGGFDGGRGDDGDDAAGSIRNSGDLTLVRVGFGQNTAYAQAGGRGGEGGEGGSSSGASGTASPDLIDAPIANLDEDREPLLEDVINPRAEPVSGEGGNGGTGATGGDGGRGGDGGDAGAAIVNEAGATLRMQDVVFGGRLSSGLVAGGNDAIGGTAGIGGRGGWGGHSNGGNGADSVSDWQLLTAAVFDVGDGHNREIRWYLDYVSSVAGSGGDGGTGGTGGNGGPGGVAGDAGAVLNLGTLTGKAAFSDHTETGNEIQAGEQNLGSGGGFGGYSRPGTGGDQRIDWSEWTGVGVYNSVASDQPGFAAWLASYDYVKSWPGSRQLYQGATGLDGTAGQEGSRGANGSNGVAGDFDNAILDKGASTAETGNSLVYLAGGGEVSEGEALKFTIARIGDVSGTATVEWRLVYDGATADDFAGVGLPSGTVQLGAVMYEPVNEISDIKYDQTNAQRIEIDVLADGLKEGAEGWRVEIVSVSGGDVVLGTSEITGTILDSDAVPDGPTPADDVLVGTNGRDVIKALGGNDSVSGRRGNDELHGNAGNDALFGEGGKDILYGRSGRDTLRGGGGNDTLDGGGGRDHLSGGKGHDMLTGGGGNDVFVFEPKGGRDTITDFQDRRDHIDLSAFEFANKREALSAFSEVGSARNDVLNFHAAGSTIRIEGIDMPQLSAADLLI